VAGSCEASIELLDSMKSTEFHAGEDLIAVSHCERLSSFTSTMQESNSVSFSPNKANSEIFFSYCKVLRQGT
jgi:hypothetical protein